MYVADSLKRLNKEAVAAAIASVDKQNELIDSWKDAGEGMTYGKYLESEYPGLDVVSCDYCGEPAIYAEPVYNPADGVRSVEGAYGMQYMCRNCLDNYGDGDENFRCPSCDKLFIAHHSWDFLAVDVDGEYYCQACAAERLEPVPVETVIRQLKAGRTKSWVRINAIPGKELIWSGEFSQYSDFPGHTSLDEVAAAVQAAADERGVSEVYPAITQGYQFACVLGVFADV